MEPLVRRSLDHALYYAVMQKELNAAMLKSVAIATRGYEFK